MKVTSASSVFSLLYGHLTRKYVMASKAVDVGMVLDGVCDDDDDDKFNKFNKFNMDMTTSC